MRAGIKKEAFDRALIRSNYSQKEFSGLVNVSLKTRILRKGNNLAGQHLEEGFLRS